MAVGKNTTWNKEKWEAILSSKNIRAVVKRKKSIFKKNRGDEISNCVELYTILLLHTGTGTKEEGNLRNHGCYTRHGRVGGGRVWSSRSKPGHGSTASVGRIDLYTATGLRFKHLNSGVYIHI